MNTADIGIATIYLIQSTYTLEEMEKDIKNMASCGITTVQLYPTANWWEREDVDPRIIPFDTTEAVMDICHENGISVILQLIGQASYMEYAPNAFVTDDMYLKDNQGNNLITYRWHDINFNHPKVAEQIDFYLGTVAKRFKDHPSLLGYNIFNETYMDSYDIYTQQEFHKWLEKKYTKISELNKSWEAAFNSWDQPVVIYRSWPSVMPLVDWQEFRTDNLKDILESFRASIKKVDQENLIFIDNVGAVTVSDNRIRGNDDWKVAEVSDVFGLSWYMKVKHPVYKELKSLLKQSITFSTMRSAAKDRQFYIAELQTNNPTGLDPEGFIDPKEISLLTWQGIANGAKGIVYWKWRPFIRGTQTTGRGLTRVGGDLSLRSDAVRELSVTYNSIKDVLKTSEVIPAKVAILYDAKNRLFIQSLRDSVWTNYKSGVDPVTDSVAGFFSCLWEKNIPVDILNINDISEDMDKYPTVYMPFQISIEPDEITLLKKYVENGGKLIADARLGFMNKLNYGYDCIPATGLDTLFGINEIETYPDDDNIKVLLESNFTGETFKGSYYRQEISTSENVSVLGRFEDGFPAITSNSYGKGQAIYFATSLGLSYFEKSDVILQKFLINLIERTTKPYLLEVGKTNAKVEVILHKTEKEYLLFALNYTEEKQSSEYSLALDDLKISKEEVILGDKENIICNIGSKKVSGEIILEPKSTTIIKFSI